MTTNRPLEEQIAEAIGADADEGAVEEIAAKLAPIREALARHRRTDEGGGWPGGCDYCDFCWPCPEARLLIECGWGE